jgi:predicted negative regulator of RcsB-dependent stress response
LNPFREFKARNADEQIDYGVLVYRGQFDMHEAAALGRAQRANVSLNDKKLDEALAEAREAVAIAPDYLPVLITEGDVAAAAGDKELARKAWTAAIESAKKLEPDSQVGYLADLNAKLSKLGAN